MPTEKCFDDLFADEVRDLYDAERQLTKALPKLAKAVTSEDLREAIESHLTETQTHVERLERVFQMLDMKPRGKHCAGIAGIIEEGSELLGGGIEDAARDAGIIAGAQRAEHYEMAAYGSLIAWAKMLRKDNVVELLTKTLDEEKAADQKLSELAEGGINEEAAGAGSMESDQEQNSGSRTAMGKPGQGSASKHARAGSSASSRRH